jgi:hypothetical protein
VRPTFDGFLRQFNPGADIALEVKVGEKNINLRGLFQQGYRAVRAAHGQNLVPLLLQIGFGKNANLFFIFDEQNNGHAYNPTTRAI